MDAHFLENVNKIHLIFQLIYKKHAPWMANFQFLANSLPVLQACTSVVVPTATIKHCDRADSLSSAE